MRKLFYLAVLAAVLMPFSAIMAQGGPSAHTEVTGCSSCHAPHGAGILEGVPLWDPAHDLTGVFVMYGEDPASTITTTLDASIPAEPDGGSRLCLGCHDGAPTDHAPGLTHDLSNTHPLSFVYDDNLATTDGELYNPLTQSSFLPLSSGTLHEDLLHSTGKVQCISCHDVHITGVTPAFLFNVKGEVTVTQWGINYRSLCRACHIK